ncbi:glycosyltransferase [Algoriphagus halophytocola]|uniref:Glycosyltransferase family 2 protein n=1 Tax=Algoriphagus halophytocola TaxID=2991499 RepID=A0ABY6MJH4_9BACT|nr:glycosyltransferase family 2 protein [Algoriphagus sp. TR-M5]UZD23937.1 glycosyltransferase family 2 protein [Algoriphagus sp. TR-M5]
MLIEGLVKLEDGYIEMIAEICFIIVTFNGENWIKECIGSIKELGSVLVVDNNSSDYTISLIENTFPFVQLIKLNENIGFGKANNIGIRKAIKDKYEYIFLLNQDAKWFSGSVVEMVRILRNNRKIGILSPLHLSSNKKDLDYLFYRYLNPFDAPSVISDAIRKELNDIYEVKFINAAAWLVPSKIFIEHGMFHPIFTHYGEDYEFSSRLKKAGYLSFLYTKASIVHDRPQVASGNAYVFNSKLIVQRFLRDFLIKGKVKHSEFAFRVTKNIFGAIINGSVKHLPEIMVVTLGFYFKLNQLRKISKDHFFIN